MSTEPDPTAEPLDPIALAQALMRRASVTPRDDGALDVLRRALEDLGFRCHRLAWGEGDEGRGARVENLYARLGERGPNFCYAGHTDVVPVGDAAAWTRDPFRAEVADGVLHGRGASDMKASIAAFVAAADRFLRDGPLTGSISLLITGDEEGPAVNGTVKVLDWLAARGERLDHCLVGEPTNPNAMGEMIKIGRRGSLSATITVRGQQGHVAYPHLADNPIPRLVRALDALSARELDTGNAHFQPSNLEITTVDVGNPATNVIPASASAHVNVRFNTEQSVDGLSRWLRETVARHAGAHDLEIIVSGEPFLTAPGPFSDLVAAAVAAETGREPELSTSGGTSDARFITRACPVLEFGLVGRTMHKVDEQIAVADVIGLMRIYQDVLRRYFDRI